MNHAQHYIERLNNPLVIALIKTYVKHRRVFFYSGNNDNIGLFTSWLLSEPIGYRHIPDTNPPPWYALGYELANLATILKVPAGDLYRKIKELENPDG